MSASPRQPAEPLRRATLRCSVKAVVVRDGRLATVKKRDHAGVLYSFPGGGQEPGETLAEAVRREFHEEMGRDVVVGDLLFVREYIGRNHEHASTEAHVHVVDHLFRCWLVDGEHTAGGPLGVDPNQLGVEWLPLAELERYRFYPRALIPALREALSRTDAVPTVYVGDIN